MISNHIIPFLLLIDGLLVSILAIAAHQLGIDPNPSWGISRYILLLFGMILFSISIYLFLGKLNNFTKSEKVKIIFMFGHIWAVIFIIYAWFITFGTLTTWKSTTRYYTQLADAFIKGQLYLDAKPGVIAEEKDPYNVESRPSFDDEIWDMSLYKGKLYLYWGPVPAILVIPIQIFSNFKVTDIYLVYFFFCGLLIINSLIILKLWRSFFIDIPAKYMVRSVFIIGLILPVLWLLNKPEVYEAAIGAGHFFLMAGIYFSILAFEKDIQKKYLFLAGLCWACSVGSRAINVFSIFFLTVLIFFLIWKQQVKPINWKLLTQFYASLLTPLLMGAILIGYYNWARFDSPLEFGLRYQITIYNLNRDMHLTFQPDYFPLNFYAYIFQPFEWISKFPFIQPIRSLNFWGENVSTPKLYAGERVIGVLFYAPFLLLAWILLFTKHSIEDKNQLQKIILYMLGGSFLINFATILFYFYSQMRFLVDVISQITLLAIMGYWALIRNRNSSKAISYILNFIITFTLITGLLLSFTGEKHRMQRLNPELMEKINSFFVPK